MWKVQLFVFVETVLLSMALVTMLAADFSRVVIILVLFLLLLYYYFGKQKGNFLLVASMIMLFFIIMLNPYVIAALLFALVYGMIVAYPYIYKENQETHLVYEEDVKKIAGWGTCSIFLRTAVNFMTSIFCVSLGKTPFIWKT